MLRYLFTFQYPKHGIYCLLDEVFWVLKKQEADAFVIKTIKLIAAPSAIVHDKSNEQEKRGQRYILRRYECVAKL